MYLLRKQVTLSNGSNTNDTTTDYIPERAGNQRNYIDYATKQEIQTSTNDVLLVLTLLLKRENVTIVWENITINWENLLICLPNGKESKIL